MDESIRSRTRTYYRIVNAKTGYWLSGEFIYKEKAIKKFNEMNALLAKRLAECGVPHDGIVLVEYTEVVTSKVIAE